MMSGLINISSGVLQDSVLDLILFVIYIDDIVDNISNNVLMFADHIMLHNAVVSMDDVNSLQQDLNEIVKLVE